jgi:hypothetical protein
MSKSLRTLAVDCENVAEVLLVVLPAELLVAYGFKNETKCVRSRLLRYTNLVVASVRCCPVTQYLINLGDYFKRKEPEYAESISLLHKLRFN